MLSPDTALERLDHLLSLARKAGADSADAVYFGEASTGIGVRLGKLEDIGRSESEEIGLRLFIGNRSAQVSISDLSPAALAEAAERARAMAAEAPEDPYAGLAPAEMLAQGPFADFDLHDPEAENLAPARLQAMALEAEDAARSMPHVSNSEGGSASCGASVSALATSHGFRGAARSSSVSVSAVVVAGEGARMQRDYDWHTTRHLVDLEASGLIGRRAGERAAARLDPVKAPTGIMPVLLDPRVSSSLVGHLMAAISGSAIARKMSFLLERNGDQIFAPGITVRDDPHRLRGLRSRPFDGEGLPTAARDIIADGRLTGWLVDSASGRQLGLPPTGHASRGSAGPPGVAPSNLWMAAGSLSPEALMADVKLGLYVTELIGMGVNTLTGDYSRGAGGFLIRDGKLAEPVSEVTIAGNLLDMFASLTPANDLEFRHAANAPTIRIEGMTVAGQ
ncbi:TldD/PmbA family protein [Sandaracinobacteroides sp. A072]|uniref:TldD/PmbA family protein n=1 Tax=Sandaracinobacteroides sp. A072 TaxID=3461146 RepID=UPI004041C899